MNTTIRLIVVISLAISLAACGRWNIERHDARSAELIDARLAPGMSSAEMLSVFPDAVSVDEEAGSSRYVVAQEYRCFWCRSPEGFVRSSDVHMRMLVFENDRLTAIEPAREWKP